MGTVDILLDDMAGRSCEGLRNTFETGLISYKPLLRTLGSSKGEQ